jgi:hypothetical protein
MFNVLTLEIIGLPLVSKIGVIMKKISLLLTVLSLMLLTQNSTYGQSELRANETDSPEITISMKRDGFPCGYVAVNEKDLKGCPAYSIVIANTGTVTYEGISSVKERGKRTFTIPLEQVKQLIADFQGIKFFDLQDKYTEKQLPNGEIRTVDHSNGTTITLKVGNKTKSVYNFYGAPQELEALQKKLEAISKHLL